MDGKKRWPAFVTLAQAAWIQDLADRTNLSGSDIIVAAIERAMDDSSFRKSLSQVHTSMEIESKKRKIAELMAEVKEMENKIEAS